MIDKWIGMGLVAIWRLSWFRCVWVDIGGLSDSGWFASVLLNFDYLLLILVDFIWFQRFGTLEWFRMDLGIFAFGLVNLIGVVRFSFMDSICLGGSGRFQYIRWDLWLGMGWLEWLRIDSEDRFKLIFVGLGRFHWIHVKMATDFDGSGKIWITLSGFDWIRADLVGIGRRCVWISKLDFACYSKI